MARDADIDAARLDVNLRGQDTVADILSGRSIPFVFATGYGADGVADRFRGVPTLTKPFRRNELNRALQQATADLRAAAAGQFADPGLQAASGKADPH